MYLALIGLGLGVAACLLAYFWGSERQRRTAADQERKTADAQLKAAVDRPRDASDLARRVRDKW